MLRYQNNSISAVSYSFGIMTTEFHHLLVWRSTSSHVGAERTSSLAICCSLCGVFKSSFLAKTRQHWPLSLPVLWCWICLSGPYSGNCWLLVRTGHMPVKYRVSSCYCIFFGQTLCWPTTPLYFRHAHVQGKRLSSTVRISLSLSLSLSVDTVMITIVI